MAKSFNRDSYGSRSRSGGSSSPSSREQDAGSAARYRRDSSSASQSSSGAGAYSRYAAGVDCSPYARDSYAQQHTERKRKKRKRILLGCLAAVLVIALGGAGAAFAYLNSIGGNLQEGVSADLLEALDNTDPGEPFYMLLMGTDKSEAREAGDDLDGTYRTDSIMLLRVDPQEKKVAAISLMRDTMVDMGEYGLQKLNAAYTIGGASYAVEVVSDLAGVPISHYAEIDFDGFRDVVNALGGIEVNVPVEIDDPEAGGYVAAGQQTLNGDQALILCRSRHTYDEIGTGKGDEYRAANQRMVISAIAKKVLDADVMTMLSTIDKLSQYVTTDMGVTDIMSLANNMRGMDMDADFYSAVNPTESQYIDGIWWEVMDETAWKQMMRRVDQGLPPTEGDQVDEATGIVMASAGEGASSEQATAEPRVIRSGYVSVRNGSEINGAASEAQEIIAEMGYTVDTGNADSPSYSGTIIVYETADQQKYAQEIADALGVGTIVQNNGEYLFETDFLVVIGADWQ